jgi:3-methylcrotonyl-CoA carboxylase alpha subunit
MIAKLIVHAPTREQAARSLAESCAAVEIWPVRSNAAFLARAARAPEFVAGAIDTGFIERHADIAVPDSNGKPAATVGGRHVLFADGEAWPFGSPVALHAGGAAAGDGALLAPMPGRIVSVGAAEGAAVTKGQKLVVVEAMKIELALSAPFDGVVEALKVKLGDQVAEGTLLVQVGIGD